MIKKQPAIKKSRLTRRALDVFEKRKTFKFNALKMSFLFFLISICSSIFFTAQAQASIYYVSTSGVNSNSGTITQPWETIQHGVDQLSDGDTLYVRGGTYRETVYISASGVFGSPITISGYSGETAIIDGEWIRPTISQDFLVDIRGDYINLKNLTVTKSLWHGVLIGPNTDYVTIDNVEVSYCENSGIMFMGSYGIAQNCTVHNNSHSHKDGVFSRGRTTWGAALTGSGADHTTIQNNTVYNNWGEGISGYNGCTYHTVQDNIVYDNWSVNIYLDSSSNCVFQRNILYFSPAMYNYNCNCENLTLRKETNYAFQDNKIINNLVKGGKWSFRAGLSLYGAALINTKIANNTIISDTNNAYYVMTISSPSGMHINSEFTNNIVYEEVSASGGIAAVGLPVAGLTFSSNLWSRTPISIAIGAGDVVANPQIAKIGPTGAGFLTADYFKLLSSSPAIEKGKDLSSSYNFDYFNIVRPQGILWDIGAHEHISAVDTTPPILSNPSPTETLPLNTTQTTISLTTNESATCRYSTTPNTAYASIPNTFSTTGGTAHSTNITGLSDGNAYNY